MGSKEDRTSNMSRDFWMPDESCRVCYDCDSQFTIFNRRHHCRVCGRVFCARCTANSIPVPSDETKSDREDGDRIRVCNFCFKQWKQGSSSGGNNEMIGSSPALSPSPSSSSLVSTQSSCCTYNSSTSAGSAGYSTGTFQHVSSSISQIPSQDEQMDSASVTPNQETEWGKADFLDATGAFTSQFGSRNRSDDEDDDYCEYRSHPEASSMSTSNVCSDTINYRQIDHFYEPHVDYSNEENTKSTCDSTLLSEEAEPSDYATKLADTQNCHVQSGSPPSDGLTGLEVEAVDYENNGLFWLPPEPVDEEDEREAFLYDDDDTGEDAAGEWGYLRSTSSGAGDCRSRDRSNEEHRKVMKKTVDGHFQALITELLQTENLPVTGQNTEESWLDIITTLSWEAATHLKPDTSMSGGMDPGGYVKVKCIASGHRNESMVVKGVVCKKNVAHRRMTSKIDKARLLLLGGALEYQRVANHLSSFDTLLQQEKDHLKMAVARIDAHHPHVLLVEKSVSRYAQEYLLTKDISLVLNIKRPLLERIARCTGAQIVPSIDNLSAPKLGYCDSFHVNRFLEDLGTAGQGGKKLSKTLMFFEGCPRPLGCTILLKGASGDELKKVKRVIQYGVFAAYHLALETSFLADEGASLPQLPLTDPIKVALPDKPPSIDRSISKIPGYIVPSSGKPQGLQYPSNAFHSRTELSLDNRQSSGAVSIAEVKLCKESSAQTPTSESVSGNVYFTNPCTVISGPRQEQLTTIDHSKKDSRLGFEDEKLGYLDVVEKHVNLEPNHDFDSEASRQGLSFSPTGDKGPSNLDSPELASLGHRNIDHHEELGPLKEEFPPSPSDYQSILVSLSTRCVYKGSVCERAHLFRIKYYSNSDKPLGRFLREDLFDQDYRCRSCDMPSEAHVHCYTHRQGSLTISVRKFQDFLLAGEREGKIWMWHRCLRCPRINGFPPATKRVAMSDAAWSLSFGKFLELSFSNHAAASRVASCGHSLHRDCLRFYGFGRMVACFRYAPIVVHSVYLPPAKLEFDNDEQEWVKKEFDEVRRHADLLFKEVLEALYQISEEITNDTGMKATELDQLIAELDLMLLKEKRDFEESLWFILKKEVKSGHPEVDILENNRLRRQLIFQSYVWDQRLVHLSRSKVQILSNLVLKKKTANSRKQTEMDVVSRCGRGFSSLDSSVVNVKPDTVLTEVTPNEIHKGADINRTLSCRQTVDTCHSSGTNLRDQSDTFEVGKTVRRAQSEGHFPNVESLSDNIDAAWEGNYPSATLASEKTIGTLSRESSRGMISSTVESISALPPNVPIDMENPSNWARIPFSALYHSFNKNSSAKAHNLGKISDYNAVYISSLKELIEQGGARLLLPTDSSDTIVPIYDDEPTSIISYCLVSQDYKTLMSEEPEKERDSLETSTSYSFLESLNLLSLHSFDEATFESLRSLGSADESTLPSASRSFSGLDSLNALHAKVSISDDGPPGKVKYTVTCYYAKQFEALRKSCCGNELDFIRSLSRCKKWGAQGGKSNVFFAKTLDDRFIIKQVTKTELESFIKFAPSYFKYLSESINSGCPTCLAKILGIYQVTSKHLKGGKESRMDVLVMENLLYRRNITRLYDLKGSSRSRYNPDASGENKVLLDQNLIEAMPTSPIFLGTKAKRLLERAVWNDTSFLASIDVMDYSLLVGVDEEKHELVLGIIDFMRQYTWDKHLETWVKASGILGGPKNASPTVISPKQYKKRFRKAMSAYFLMVPDEWPSSMIVRSGSQSDLCEDKSQDK